MSEYVERRKMIEFEVPSMSSLYWIKGSVQSSIEQLEKTKSFFDTCNEGSGDTSSIREAIASLQALKDAVATVQLISQQEYQAWCMQQAELNRLQQEVGITEAAPSPTEDPDEEV